VVAHALPGPGGEPALAGFVVSKSVGTAVRRNLVKRRLRAAVRPRLADLAGWMVVFRARPEAASADYARLQADVDHCCTTLHEMAWHEVTQQHQTADAATRKATR
jgi:ribonuclease P protein component